MTMKNRSSFEEVMVKKTLRNCSLKEIILLLDTDGKKCPNVISQDIYDSLKQMPGGNPLSWKRWNDKELNMILSKFSGKTELVDLVKSIAAANNTEYEYNLDIPKSGTLAQFLGILLAAITVEIQANKYVYVDLEKDGISNSCYVIGFDTSGLVGINLLRQVGADTGQVFYASGNCPLVGFVLDVLQTYQQENGDGTVYITFDKLAEAIKDKEEYTRN